MIFTSEELKVIRDIFEGQMLCAQFFKDQDLIDYWSSMMASSSPILDREDAEVILGELQFYENPVILGLRAKLAGYSH